MAVDLSMPILVVDDYNTMIRIIRNLLKQLGFEDVDDATDGGAALAKIAGQELRPGDLRLEHGADDRLRPAASEVRSDPALGTIPFIMVTAESKTENVIAAKTRRGQQLHRQAVQRADAPAQDRRRCSPTSRARRWRRSRLETACSRYHASRRITAFG